MTVEASLVHQSFLCSSQRILGAQTLVFISFLQSIDRLATIVSVSMLERFRCLRHRIQVRAVPSCVGIAVINVGGCRFLNSEGLLFSRALQTRVCKSGHGRIEFPEFFPILLAAGLIGVSERRVVGAFAAHGANRKSLSLGGNFFGCRLSPRVGSQAVPCHFTETFPQDVLKLLSPLRTRLTGLFKALPSSHVVIVGSTSHLTGDRAHQPATVTISVSGPIHPQKFLTNAHLVIQVLGSPSHHGPT